MLTQLTELLQLCELVVHAARLRRRGSLLLLVLLLLLLLVLLLLVLLGPSALLTALNATVHR